MSTLPPSTPPAKRQKTSPSSTTNISESITTTSEMASSSTPAAPPTTNVETSPPLLIKKLSEHATLPTRGSAFAAGYDIYASKDAWIPGHGKALIETDISLAVPAGTYGRVAPRSGLASKHHIDVGAGVIDADYRGPLKVLLFNFGAAQFEVKKGDRIAQLVLERIYTPEVVEVTELEESVRGAGGFGSTG